MNNKSPYRRLRLILFLVLASIIIISPQFKKASAGSGLDGDIDQDGFTPNEGDCDDNDPDVYPGYGSCAVPIPEIKLVMEDVEKLVDAGTINDGQANALLAKLENAIQKIESDKINAAIGSLNAFIKQIKAFMNSGVIPPEDPEAYEVGKQLIRDVESIIEKLKMG